MCTELLSFTVLSPGDKIDVTPLQLLEQGASWSLQSSPAYGERQEHYPTLSKRRPDWVIDNQIVLGSAAKCQTLFHADENSQVRLQKDTANSIELLTA